MEVISCYKKRFSKIERQKKNTLWKILCEIFFQKYINKDDVLLDVGAGYCEFVNNIKCGEKYALDINPDTKIFANKEVKVISDSLFNLSVKYKGRFNTLFVSNFLEHLDSKEELINAFKIFYSLLRKDGKLLILQPNIDLVKERYWNFIDHKIAINAQSLKEVLGLSGFNVEMFVNRFLPYTTKSSLFVPNKFIITTYLKIPEIVRPFAGQSFVLAKKSKRP